jgi:hypothetical protein
VPALRNWAPWAKPDWEVIEHCIILWYWISILHKENQN